MGLVAHAANQDFGTDRLGSVMSEGGEPAIRALRRGRGDRLRSPLMFAALSEFLKRSMTWATSSVVHLAVCAVGAGAMLTAIAGSWPGSQGLNPLTWLGTVATIAAFLVALGIYRLQNRQQDDAHAELLDRLDGQDDLLKSFAEREEPAPVADGDVSAALPDLDALTPAQRDAIESQYGEGSIAAAWKTGAGRGNRARLVRLNDGRIVSVYSGGRAGGTYVHEVEHRHGSI